MDDNFFSFDDLLLPKHYCCEATLSKIQAGDDAIPNIDALIVGFPRSGCSWVMEMVWMILNNGDLDQARGLEVKSKYSRLEQDDTNFSRTKELKIKIVISHLPLKFLGNILSRCRKIILLQRDPRDCVWSLFHYYTKNPKLGQFKGSWTDFFELYKEHKIMYGYHCEWMQPWMEHKMDNMEIFQYECLHNNRYGYIRNMAKFILDDCFEYIGVKMMDICQWISFDNMKGQSKKPEYSLDPTLLDPEITNYLREGKWKDWNGVMTDDEMDFFSPRK